MARHQLQGEASSGATFERTRQVRLTPGEY